MYWTEIFFFLSVTMVTALCWYFVGNMICNIYTEKEDKPRDI